MNVCVYIYIYTHINIQSLSYYYVPLRDKDLGNNLTSRLKLLSKEHASLQSYGSEPSR